MNEKTRKPAEDPGEPKPQSVREVLTLAEAAEFLGISREVLSLEVRAGNIPAGKLRKRWLFIRADLLEFLRASYHPRQRAVTWGGTTRQPQIEALPGQTAALAEYEALLGLHDKKNDRKKRKPTA